LSSIRPESEYAKLSSSLPDGGLPRGMDDDDDASLPYNGTLPYKSIPIVAGPTARYVAWPPIVMRIEKLGYIVDSK
jgi:hypothetical protein